MPLAADKRKRVLVTEAKVVARQAFTRAEQLESEILQRWPDAWEQMDRMRAEPAYMWPDWCLLPMGAAAAVALRPGVPYPQPHHIAAMSALYAWRYCLSVYVVEPTLMGRLLTQVPDAVGLDDLTGLPEWCVYIADLDGERSAGLWIHLEYDVNSGRPELRLLLDVPDIATLPVPVYLDRDSLTEALGDFRATSLASLAGPGEVVPGQDVHGGLLDSGVAQFAERIEGYVACAAYLARPEADISELARPGIRPARRRRLARGRSVWLVGHQSLTQALA